MKSKLPLPFSRFTFALAIVGSLAVISACTGMDGTPAPEGEPAAEPAAEPASEPEFTADADIIADALNYTAGGFTEVTAAPFSSAHGGADVTIFVSDDDLADYNTIDPQAVTGPTFSEGAMIIKQHKNAAGGDDAITVMYKQAEGFAPANGDWWWARIEADESVTVSGPNVGGCLGCHNSVSASDYVYGLD